MCLTSDCTPDAQRAGFTRRLRAGESRSLSFQLNSLTTQFHEICPLRRFVNNQSCENPVNHRRTPK